MNYLEGLGTRAKKAAAVMNTLDSAARNLGLRASASALIKESEEILEANEKDVVMARKNGISEIMIDRLQLDEQKIAAMSEGLMQLSELKDPIGEVMEMFTRPNGLKIEKVRVPLGVIGIIYESRPNVTADAFGLCFKSGNAVILKGGSDAINTNIAITHVIRKALEAEKLPDDSLLMIEDTSRETATEFMKLKGYIDLLIPRGGAGLIHAVVDNATVPVIETGVGNCHVYVDEFADINMAADIVDNSKTEKMSVCNACESLVIHKNIAESAIPVIYQRLHSKEIEVRGSRDAMEIQPGIVPADESDYAEEYLDRIISLKIVNNIDEAIEHINHYSTHHSESIVTDNEENAEKFLKEIDSACVYVNASTQFTDGFQFGFGAEIGISTQKFHARGPMGLEALTSYKYEIHGNGQIRKR